MSLHGESEEELISMDDVAIEDEAEDDETVAPVRYETTSYGIDFDVEGVVRRIKRDDIFIPEFQRSFIWNLGEASRFIESLLLGLPVPGIFLSQEPESGRLLVIDGQQRLKGQCPVNQPSSHASRLIANTPLSITATQAATAQVGCQLLLIGNIPLVGISTPRNICLQTDETYGLSLLPGNSTRAYSFFRPGG